MPGPLSYQAVVLAGGDDKRLHPLTSGCAKALLPVANKPLLTYSLNLLYNAGLRHAFIVVIGDEATQSIQSWVSTEYAASTNGKLTCEIVKAPKESTGTADALRAVAGRVTAKTLVVMAGDLITDFPVNALVAKHQLDGALATALLCKRKVSPMTETKPGKAPKNVDYIGLDKTGERLMFYATSPESLRDLKIPMACVEHTGSMTIRSDLVDAHLYVLDRSVLSLVESQPTLSSIRQDLLPFLTRQQRKSAAIARQSLAGGGGPGGGAGGAGGSQADRAMSLTTASSLPVGSEIDKHDVLSALDADLPDYMSMSHCPRQQSSSSKAPGGPDSLRVHVVAPDSGVYCCRIADASSYCEVNRDLADARTALHLTGLKAHATMENVVPHGTTIGTKSTITAACVLGEHCVLGDKSSIKRSVLGSNVKLGNNVKILNSVLQDGVVVQDGAMVQNTVLCAGVTVKERAALKDCQIGPGFVVTGGKEYNGEALGGKVNSSAH